MAGTMFNADEVGVGKGNPSGYAWVAPKGTTLPTNAKTPIGDDFKGLGYVNEDGLTQTTDSEAEDLKDWAGRVIKKAPGSFSETYAVAFMQSRAEVLKVYYGDANVTDDGKGGITVKHNGAFSEERVFVFETLITDTLIERTVIPRGSIQERDDIERTSESAMVYPVTITALADADGNTAYTYYYDSAKDTSLTE